MENSVSGRIVAINSEREYIFCFSSESYDCVRGKILHLDSGKLSIFFNKFRPDTIIIQEDSLFGIIDHKLRFPSFYHDIGEYSSLPLIALTGIIPIGRMEYGLSSALIAGGIAIGVAFVMALPVFIEPLFVRKYKIKNGNWKLRKKSILNGE